MYRRGEGVRQDKVEGAKWCLKAAKQGEVAAMANIGSYYTADTEGVPYDLIEAYKWLTLALEGGRFDVMWILADVKRDMSRKQIAKAERRITEWRKQRGW